MDATTQTASPPTRGRMVARRLPLWVLIGAFLGILAGITFGERASLLKPLGDVYAMMLLSVVYPYILSSLIVGLGSLAVGRARRLLQASWGVYVFLWVTVFAAIFVLTQAIPPPAPPAEVATAASRRGAHAPADDHPGQSDRRARPEFRAGHHRVCGHLRTRGADDRFKSLVSRNHGDDQAGEPESVGVGHLARPGRRVRVVRRDGGNDRAACRRHACRVHGAVPDRHRRARVRRVAARAVGDRAGQRPRASGRASAGFRARPGDDLADVRAAADPRRRRAQDRRGGSRRRRGKRHHAGDDLAFLRVHVARKLFRRAVHRLCVPALSGDVACVADGAARPLHLAVGERIAEHDAQRGDVHEPVAGAAGRHAAALRGGDDRHALRPGGALGVRLCLRGDRGSVRLLPEHGAAPVQR